MTAQSAWLREAHSVRAKLSALGRLAAAVAFALLVNAFVCGALANPHDRYGARLIWLAVLAVGLAPLCAYARAETREWQLTAVDPPEAPVFARVREASGA